MEKSKYLLEDHHFLTWYMFPLRENKQNSWVRPRINLTNFYFLIAVDFAVVSNSNLDACWVEHSRALYSNRVL